MQLSLSERLALAMELHQSGIDEQAHAANYRLGFSADKLSPTHFEHLSGFLNHFRSWSTTDVFCICVLQPVLRNYPEKTLELLREWSVSENRWKRRISVVAFVGKIGASGQFVDACLERCEALVAELQSAGAMCAAVVGRVEPADKVRVRLEA